MDILNIPLSWELVKDIFLAFILCFILYLHRKEVTGLKQFSMKDELTKLASKGKFYDDAQHAIARRHRENKNLGKRARKNISVAFIDLDGFKAVNDGNHLRGDRILVEFANFISSKTRASDTVARFGGDEFVILLNDSDQDDAQKFCRKLQDDLSSYWFDSGYDPLRLGASVSSASTSEGFNSAAEMIEKADARMQTQKDARKKAVKA